METFEDYRLNLSQVIYYSFSYGSDKFKEKYPETSLLENKVEFHKACVEGFKLAQKELISEITKYQSLLRDSTIALKEARRKREKESQKSIENDIDIIEQRLSNYHHVADGIAWQILGGQIHIARRLHIGQKTAKFLDTSNLDSSITASDQINLDPNHFALISDLTSFVQIGDLLVRSDNNVHILELKEGKVNDAILEIFDEISCPSFEFSKEELATKYSSDTVKQIIRIQNQKKRADRAVNVMNSDNGLDPKSENQIIVSTPSIDTENYHEELRGLYNDLQTSTWAYTVVDECLHIGMYRDEGLFMAPMAINEILKEQTDNFLIIDWLSITSNLSEPIFAKPFPQEFQIDILTGKIKVIIGLDVDKLIKVFNEIGLQTRWLSTKETAKINQRYKLNQPFMIKKRGILIKLPNEYDSCLYGGIISKILYDNIKPSNIAETLLTTHTKEISVD